jgi:CII-binding regulator of phage lambda lysogenization HflD
MIIMKAFAAAAFAEGITPLADIAQKPAKYYDKTLCLKGTVDSARKISAQDGHYVLAAVKDAQSSVLVVVKSSETYAAGSTLTACGSFQQEIKTGTETLGNSLRAASVSVKPAEKPVKTVKLRHSTTFTHR